MFILDIIGSDVVEACAHFAFSDKRYPHGIGTSRTRIDRIVDSDWILQYGISVVSSPVECYFYSTRTCSSRER